jgi:hypothetical protein
MVPGALIVAVNSTREPGNSFLSVGFQFYPHRATGAGPQPAPVEPEEVLPQIETSFRKFVFPLRGLHGRVRLLVRSKRDSVRNYEFEV